jgi:CO/xanthine dehydrogenase Mo-binding subunit
MRLGLAEALGLAPEKIRVISPFVGGGFGSKGGIWPYTILAAIAARHVGRPVKLVLARTQMFASVSYRSQTVQDVTLGALLGPTGAILAMPIAGFVAVVLVELREARKISMTQTVRVAPDSAPAEASLATHDPAQA